ncbi:uncharacterized protein VP01_12652g1, partial [Puccinia sorghi]
NDTLGVFLSRLSSQHLGCKFCCAPVAGCCPSSTMQLHSLFSVSLRSISSLQMDDTVALIYTDGSYNPAEGGAGAVICLESNMALSMALGNNPHISNHECEVLWGVQTPHLEYLVFHFLSHGQDHYRLRVEPSFLPHLTVFRFAHHSLCM